MAGGMSKLLDAAAAAARRATRRRKMAIKKRSKSVSRQPAAAPSGGADPRSEAMGLDLAHGGFTALG